MSLLASDVQELFNSKEELHPDLASCIVEEGGLGPCLKHPLVFGLFYHPGMNGLFNKQYIHKKEYAEKCLKEENWSGYLFMFERPYRIEKFFEIREKLNDKQYWEILGNIWTDSENLWQYKPFLSCLLNEDRAEKECMMDEDERLFLEKLPQKVRIYRGHQKSNKKGYSWTLSYWKAKWFSKRFDQPTSGVVEAVVDKSEIIAVFLGRGEFEIVVAPHKIKAKTIKFKEREEWIQNLKYEIEKNSLSKNRHSVHGPWHWEKVEDNALKLASKTTGCDKLVVQLFALIHDSKRLNDNEDKDHGLRAAEYANKLFEEGKLKITKKQLVELMEACENHEKGFVSENPTIGVCWDADRLDLTRVGIIPDPKLLSTSAAKKLLWS